MRLYEDKQEEVIAKFQEVLDAYKVLEQKCVNFKDACEGIKILDFKSKYLEEFCSGDLKKKIDGMEQDVLNEYYPVDDATDEKDYIKAGDRYHNSIELRNQVFNH